jgi:23S rRNA (uracil1939-C5)-methyltransferase
LQANLAGDKGRANAFRMTAEKFLETAKPIWDAIIIDPPRTGLSRAVQENLARLQAKRLVYVSCDPTTLARDAAALCRSGYHIRSVHMVDQFPQTFHIESIVHMERE